MSALGFVGGLAGAVAIGIYGLIAFVFLTAAMLEMAERGRTGRLSIFLAFAGAMLWPVSLFIASVAAAHALRRRREARRPSSEPQRSGSDKSMISLVEREGGNSRAQGRAVPDQRPLVQPVRPVDGHGTPSAAFTPETSTHAVSGPCLPVPAIGGHLVRTLAPLQIQPQPPFAMPGPDSRCRIILSPRQVLATVRYGESKPSTNRDRLRQTGFSTSKKGKTD
ncbi:hypothetical protein [Pannonibacter sp. I15F10I1]|uniref:hypothetical protein n=1 Tax=Pannonibacter sp. I15F10I1 TaxID=2003580 RepID=UPI0016492D7B|nr:hypothetical protein [Pannonibacter sp. I15F10I1]